MREVERVAYSEHYHTDLRAYVEAAWAVRAVVEPTANAERLANWRARFGTDDRLWAKERTARAIQPTTNVVKFQAPPCCRSDLRASHSRL